MHPQIINGKVSTYNKLTFVWISNGNISTYNKLTLVWIKVKGQIN